MNNFNYKDFTAFSYYSNIPEREIASNLSHFKSNQSMDHELY